MPPAGLMDIVNSTVKSLDMLVRDRLNYLAVGHRQGDRSGIYHLSIQAKLSTSHVQTSPLLTMGCSSVSNTSAPRCIFAWAVTSCGQLHRVDWVSFY